MAVDAVLLPKVESCEQVCAYERGLVGARAAELPLWVMIETPRGVLGIERILAGCPRIEVVVMGTSDLVKELQARHTQERHALLPSLAHCVLVGRAFDRVVLDGVHLDFQKRRDVRARVPARARPRLRRQDADPSVADRYGKCSVRAERLTTSHRRG